MAAPMFTVKHDSPAHWAMRIGAGVLLGATVLWLVTKGSTSLVSDVTNSLVLAIAAMSLNLVLGYTGMISIGHSAFFGVGAYVTGIFISRYHWNPWLTFPMAFVIAFVIGAVVSLPALRIKGIYLALVTLSLALVFPAVIKWKKLEWLTAGSGGLKNTTFDRKMRQFEIFGHDFFGNVRGPEGKASFYFWIAFVLAVAAYLICRGLVKSRVGRSLIAIRDNETAAAVMGVPLASTKALVFGVSAGVCSLAGSWTALNVGNVAPADTGYMTLEGSIAFLVVMVIGGAGHLWGPILGAFVYTFVASSMSDWASDDKIPAVLRPLLAWSKAPPATGVFAVALIVVMFVAPFGLVGIWNRLARRVVAVLPAPAGSTAWQRGDEIPADPPLDAGPFDTHPGAEGNIDEAALADSAAAYDGQPTTSPTTTSPTTTTSTTNQGEP